MDICNNSWIHKISPFYGKYRLHQNLLGFESNSRSKQKKWEQMYRSEPTLQFSLKMTMLEKNRSVGIYSTSLKLPGFHLCSVQNILDCKCSCYHQRIAACYSWNDRTDPSNCEFYQKEPKNAIINKILQFISHFPHTCWQSENQINLYPSQCAGRNSEQLPYANYR